MEKAGAFSRDAKGQYVIDFGKAKEAMNGWAALILQTQGDGNVEFATKYRAENGGITPALQADLDKINGAGTDQTRRKDCQKGGDRGGSGNKNPQDNEKDNKIINKQIIKKAPYISG